MSKGALHNFSSLRLAIFDTSKGRGGTCQNGGKKGKIKG